MISPTVVLQALANAGIGEKMLSWIHDLLNGRTGAVQFQNEYSFCMAFKNGTPQGNRLLNLKLPTSVQLVAYADDLPLSCCHPGKCKVIKNIQTAINSLNAEATLGMKFSPAKSKAMWFYTNKSDEVITFDWREKLAANPHQTTEADSPQ